MTSEPAGPDERHPPTIELKATEVQTPGQDTPQGSGDDTVNGPASAAATSGSEPSGAPVQHEPGPAETAPPPASGSSQMIFHAISAIVGAVVAAAIVAGLWIGGIVPPRQGDRTFCDGAFRDSIRCNRRIEAKCKTSQRGSASSNMRSRTSPISKR